MNGSQNPLDPLQTSWLPSREYMAEKWLMVCDWIMVEMSKVIMHIFNFFFILFFIFIVY